MRPRRLRGPGHQRRRSNRGLLNRDRVKRLKRLRTSRHQHCQPNRSSRSPNLQPVLRSVIRRHAGPLPCILPGNVRTGSTRVGVVLACSSRTAGVAGCAASARPNLDHREIADVRSALLPSVARPRSRAAGFATTACTRGSSVLASGASAAAAAGPICHVRGSCRGRHAHRLARSPSPMDSDRKVSGAATTSRRAGS